MVTTRGITHGARGVAARPQGLPLLSARTISALWSRAVAEPFAHPAYMVEEAGRWR